MTDISQLDEWRQSAVDISTQEARRALGIVGDREDARND